MTGARLFTRRLTLESHSPVLVLGNQKTGSTAVARLLAHLGDLSATTDIHPLQSSSVPIENDPESIASLIQRLRYYFRRELIKENELTAATDALLAVLPQARPVFVVRHPVQNIRSILDRLNLSGRPLSLQTLNLTGSGWASIVRGDDLGIQADDQITALAMRWTRVTEIYLRHQARLHLVRYEDFMADKGTTIRTLADRLGIEEKQDIEPLFDIQFQPRGDHRSTPPTEFFSNRALAIINQQCASGMDALSYEPIRASSCP